MRGAASAAAHAAPDAPDAPAAPDVNAPAPTPEKELEAAPPSPSTEKEWLQEGRMGKLTSWRLDRRSLSRSMTRWPHYIQGCQHILCRFLLDYCYLPKVRVKPYFPVILYDTWSG